MRFAASKGDCPEQEVMNVLGQGCAKCAPVKEHPAMEGPRNGLSHLNEHSTRVREAHARMGTQLKPKKVLE